MLFFRLEFEVSVLLADLLRMINWSAAVLLLFVAAIHLLVRDLLFQELSKVFLILGNHFVASVAFKLEIGLFVGKVALELLFRGTLLLSLRYLSLDI